MPSVFRNGWQTYASMPHFCHTEDPLLELLVPLSRYTQDHLAFFPPFHGEETGKIATGNTEHKTNISEDEKPYFSLP